MTITATPSIDSSHAPTGAARFSRATRTRHDDVRAVRTVLRSEWIKLSSVRVNTVILGGTAAIGAFVSWACATFVTDEVQTVSEVFIFSTVLTAVIAAVAGIVLFTAEAQHGTLATALAAQPARWVLVAAKTVAAAAFGLVLGAAGMTAGFAGAVLGGLAMGDTSTMVVTTLWALLFTSLSAVLGLGFGLIVRHTAGTITGVLVWGLVIENMLTVFTAEQVSRFLPFVAGNNLLGIEGEGAFAENPALALTRPQDALIFGGYAIAALAIGTVLLYRRDAN